MVVVKDKAQTQGLSPLSVAPKNEATLEKETLSFSQLLQGFVVLGKARQSEKSAQNGLPQNELAIASLKSESAPKQPNAKHKAGRIEVAELQSPLQATKKEAPTTLAQLMGASNETATPRAEITLNPQITGNLTTQEIKTLIHEAKEYLKNKITQTDGFKLAEIASLPKTLKGLAQVAQKLGLDLSKVTLEEVKRGAVGASKELSVQSDGAQKETPASVATTQNTPKQEAKSQNAKLAQAQNAQEQKNEPTAEKFVEQRGEPKSKETPLFKAQTPTEISTQEMVNAKSVAFEMKKPKEKGDENLKLLLRAQTAQKSDSSVGVDLSVAAAKAIAPLHTQTQAQANPAQNLESFLQGKSGEESALLVKADTAVVNAKTEALEIKINEAKQMTRYLSGDIKTAIEEYKSPFTRVKVQLNPQRLGEIDLTVVQRGNNLHVTLSSNNAAINALAMNASDLKLQLTNNGIQNATLNFSSNAQSQDGSASGQQSNQQRREEARKEYGHTRNEEAREEILSSLEIVVPNYA